MRRRGRSCLLLAPIAAAALAAGPSRGIAEEGRTPLAGEEYAGEVFGRKVDVSPRDRSRQLAVLLGSNVALTPIADSRIEPFAAVYYRRIAETTFLRAVLGGFSNEADFSEEWRGVLLSAHAENEVSPFPLTDAIDDDEVRSDRVRWSAGSGWVGLGKRWPVAPFQLDNELRVELFYEAGWLATQRTRYTEGPVELPPNTLVHGVHLRVRYDALRRNLLELPHEGVALGGDVEFARRDRWSDHRSSLVAFDGEKTRDFVKVSAYAVAATPIPLLPERHRALLHLHAGASPHDSLDRYSAFRLGGGPRPTESFDLARHPYPGAAFDQLYVRDYVIGTVEYRFEALFFLYVHVRGTMALLNHVVRGPGGARWVRDRAECFSAGITSGFVWSSSIYVEYAFDTGALRGGRAGHGVLLVWTKSF